MKTWLKVLGVGMCASILAGCNLPDDTETDDNQSTSTARDRAIVDAIFHASMSWQNQMSKDKPTRQINIPINSRVAGPAGGYMNTVGSVTGNYSFTDAGYITSGFVSIGFSITFTDYAMTIDGQRFVVNGAPYVSVTGTFTIAAGGRSFGTASSIRIGGAYRVDGPGGSQTININLTIIVDSDGGGGHVSGTIGGVSVNYTY